MHTRDKPHNVTRSCFYLKNGVTPSQGGNVLLNCMLRYFKHKITSIFHEALY